MDSLVLELPSLLNQLNPQHLSCLLLECRTLARHPTGAASPAQQAAMAAATRLALCRFPHLTSLSLTAESLVPEDAAALAALTRLECVSLVSAAHIPPAVVAAAAGLQGLAELALEAAAGPPPPLGVLPRLVGLPRLQHLKLHLRGCEGWMEAPPALPAILSFDYWCSGGVQVGRAAQRQLLALAKTRPQASGLCARALRLGPRPACPPPCPHRSWEARACVLVNSTHLQKRPGCLWSWIGAARRTWPWRRC